MQGKKYNTILFTFLSVQNYKNAQIADFKGQQRLNVTDNGLFNYKYIG